MLYIDITQLVSWSGRLTGIPRSMNELTNRFIDEPNCKTVVWDAESSNFILVDFHKLRRLEVKQINDSKVKSKIKTLIKKSDRAYSVALKIYNLQKTKTTIKSATFKPGDILFISWGLWDQQGYIKSVLNAKSSSAKVVQIVHDMLPLTEPQFSGHSKETLKNYVTQVYPKCSLLIAVSKCAKQDTKQWMGQRNLTIPPIKVLRWGEDFIADGSIKPKDKNFVNSGLKGKDFILCVGTIEARKNHSLLYYVYKLAAQKNIKLPKIVVVGRRGWLTDNIYEIITNDPQTKDNIVILEDISDEELTWLYKNCMFSIYPSFYEGWGLPIAESLARGVPCISSNTSSMPEIAGDLIDYFSPFSPEECLSAIQKLLLPRNLEEAVKKAALYKPTSWDMSFKSVKMYIEEI